MKGCKICFESLIRLTAVLGHNVHLQNIRHARQSEGSQQLRCRGHV